MKVQTLKIPGMLLIDLNRHGDDRGFFMEMYRRSELEKAGLKLDFVQDNRSLSEKNVVRGMHYQINRPQGHMVSVLHGKIFDVGVDLRKNSPMFGQWCGIELSAEKPQQLFLPPGVAHGFCTLADKNELYYKCTDYYCAEEEGGLLWNDAQVGVEWPIDHPLIKERDAAFPVLGSIPAWRLPQVLI